MTKPVKIMKVTTTDLIVVAPVQEATLMIVIFVDIVTSNQLLVITRAKITL